MAETYSVPHSNGRMPRLEPPPNFGVQLAEKKKSVAGSASSCSIVTRGASGERAVEWLRVHFPELSA